MSFLSSVVVVVWIYNRGRQSPARGPNPAREFRPSGPRRLVSFNIKFGPENVPNDERLFSCWAWFSRTLIVNADRLSYTRWRWLTPFTLDPSLVKLGHFWWSWKNSMKLKTGGVDLKTILNKILKNLQFSSQCFCRHDMTSWWGGSASPLIKFFT